jgi:hypothetical protein
MGTRLHLSAACCSAAKISATTASLMIWSNLFVGQRTVLDQHW